MAVIARTTFALGVLLISVEVISVEVISAQLAAQPTAELASVMHLRKSQNRNEVHYALRHDPSCQPLGSTPLYAYWRMHERGAGLVEPLLAREQPAYGIAQQAVEARDDGWRVRWTLEALPTRPIVVYVWRQPDGRCAFRTELGIDGGSARFVDAFVQLGLFSVRFVELTGLRDGRRVVERVRP